MSQLAPTATKQNSLSHRMVKKIARSANTQQRHTLTSQQLHGQTFYRVNQKWFADFQHAYDYMKIVWRREPVARQHREAQRFEVARDALLGISTGIITIFMIGFCVEIWSAYNA